MRISVMQLKEAFYAECNRASNLSLGRSFFTAFEVGMFLNSGYMACVNKRLGILDERFLPQDKRMTQNNPTQIPDSMRILLDFGSLYENEFIQAASNPKHGTFPVEG